MCNGPEIYGEMPTVVESDLWRVELNPNQQHLGRTFVGLRKHKNTLSALSGEEWLDFKRIHTVLEIGLRAAFDPNLLNTMFLMNDAVRDGQVPHVHGHIIPRYCGQRQFNGRTFTDGAWPRQYNTGNDKKYIPTTEEILLITEAIRKGINMNF